jgi:hypothetical protein
MDNKELSFGQCSAVVGLFLVGLAGLFVFYSQRAYRNYSNISGVLTERGRACKMEPTDQIGGTLLVVKPKYIQQELVDKGVKVCAHQELEYYKSLSNALPLKGVFDPKAKVLVLPPINPDVNVINSFLNDSASGRFNGATEKIYAYVIISGSGKSKDIKIEWRSLNKREEKLLDLPENFLK